MKRIIMVGVALFLLAGCQRYSGGEPVASEKEDPKQEQKEETNEKPEEKLTIDEQIKTSINKKLGKETNMDKKRIVDLKVNDHAGTEKTDDKIILLTLAGDENLSSEMAIKGMLMDSSKSFQEVFKNEEAEEVTLFWQFPLEDAYGKSADENVIKITLTKATFEKIEWKSFDYNNYEVIADQFWMHNALKNELK